MRRHLLRPIQPRRRLRQPVLQLNQTLRAPLPHLLHLVPPAHLAHIQPRRLVVRGAARAQGLQLLRLLLVGGLVGGGGALGGVAAEVGDLLGEGFLLRFEGADLVNQAGVNGLEFCKTSIRKNAWEEKSKILLRGRV